MMFLRSDAQRIDVRQRPERRVANVRELTGMSTDDEGRRPPPHVLTLARRTAEEHVAEAVRQSDRIQAQARAGADQVVRDAQARAVMMLHEAEQTRSEARVKAERMTRDAQARADRARRDADRVVTEARVRAEQIAADARAEAGESGRRAQLRHEDIVAGLAAKQAAVQHQIDLLEQYDRDYRAQLVTFVQAHLQAFGVGTWQTEPPAQRASVAITATVPTQQSGTAATTGGVGTAGRGSND